MKSSSFFEWVSNRPLGSKYFYRSHEVSLNLNWWRDFFFLQKALENKWSWWEMMNVDFMATEWCIHFNFTVRSNIIAASNCLSGYSLSDSNTPNLTSKYLQSAFFIRAHENPHGPTKKWIYIFMWANFVAHGVESLHDLFMRCSKRINCSGNTYYSLLSKWHGKQVYRNTNHLLNSWLKSLV